MNGKITGLIIAAMVGFFISASAAAYLLNINQPTVAPTGEMDFTVSAT